MLLLTCAHRATLTQHIYTYTITYVKMYNCIYALDFCLHLYVVCICLEVYPDDSLKEPFLFSQKLFSNFYMAWNEIFQTKLSRIRYRTQSFLGLFYRYNIFFPFIFFLNIWEWSFWERWAMLSLLITSIR